MPLALMTEETDRLSSLRERLAHLRNKVEPVIEPAEEPLPAIPPLPAPSGTLWVLMRTASKKSNVVAIYSSREGLLSRLERIAKVNNGYPLKNVTPNLWRIGPENDLALEKTILFSALEVNHFDY